MTTEFHAPSVEMTHWRIVFAVADLATSVKLINEISRLLQREGAFAKNFTAYSSADAADPS